MEQKTLYIEDIKSILPHRYPFLLIDRVIEFEAGKSGTAIKNVSANEEFFNGHFPATATMPGVLILEAMSQTAAVIGAIGQAEGNIILLTSVENAKFKNRVVPGDQLVIKVEKVAEKRNFFKWKAEAFVDGKLCVSAVLGAMNSGKQSL